MTQSRDMYFWQNIYVSRFKSNALILVVIFNILYSMFDLICYIQMKERYVQYFSSLACFIFITFRLLLFSKDLKNNSKISSSIISTIEEAEDIDEEQFKAWLNQHNDFSKNMKRVCRKYGYTLSKRVPMEEFLYDSEHDLLFCRNAKVCCKHFFEYTQNQVLSGWNYILAQQLFIYFFKVSKPL